MNDASRLIRGTDHHLVLVEAFTIQHRTDTDNLRSDDQICCYARAPGVNLIQVAPHITHIGNAVRHKQRQCALRGPAKVHLHVPQTRDQEFPATIDDRTRPPAGVAWALSTDTIRFPSISTSLCPRSLPVRVSMTATSFIRRREVASGFAMVGLARAATAASNATL